MVYIFILTSKVAMFISEWYQRVIGVKTHILTILYKISRDGHKYKTKNEVQLSRVIVADTKSLVS